MSDDNHQDGGDTAGAAQPGAGPADAGQSGDGTAGDGYAYYGPFGPGAPLAGDDGWYDQGAYGQAPYDQAPYDQTPYDQTAYEQTRHDQGSYRPGPYDQAAGAGPDLDDTQPIAAQSGDTQPIAAQSGDTQPIAAQSGDAQPGPSPSFVSGGLSDGLSDSHSRFPAPPGVPPLRPRPPTAASGAPLPPAGDTRERKPRRGVAVIAIAAVTALLVGGAAGYGGAVLAGSAGTETSAAPRPTSGTDPQRSPVAPPPPEADTVAIAKKVLPSAVTIQVGDRTSGGSTGSGFVLDDDGRIMTNNHVVADAGGSQEIQVTFSDGKRAEAQVLGRSPSYDLAVIKVAAGKHLVPVAIGDSASTQVGDPAIAVGSPLGLGGTVTEGIISARDRPVVVGGDEDAENSSAYINGLQTDAPINPGNSGGPLVDAGGRVIGVNSANLTVGQSGGQGGNIGLGFAIPINQAMVIGEMLIKDGKATYPVIGATVSSQTDDTGVRLANVEPNGPAADAGLRGDDVITAIDGASVARAENLIVTIRTHRPGDTITLTYLRGGKSSEVKVTLDGKEG